MKHEKQYYMQGWICKTAFGFSWGWEPSLSSSIGWNSNIGAAVLWVPSNSRWPRGLILLAAPSGNRRPRFGPGQCGQFKQRTLYRARKHTDHTLREIENKKKYLQTQSKCKKTCFSHYWALGRETEVTSKSSWPQAGLCEDWVPSLQGWKNPSKNLNENGAMLVVYSSFQE